MYVSTAQVLRRFAQKVASISPKLDELSKTQLEPKKPAPQQGPQDALRTGFAGKSTDKIVNAVEDATRKPSLTHSALSGIDSVVDAGKSVANRTGLNWKLNADPLTMGVGGLGGAGLLYAIAKLRQSEADRKRGKQPILAPIMGAAGGAALAPLLMALHTRLRSPSAGPALPGDLATLDANSRGQGAGVFVPPNVDKAPIA